MSHAPPLQCTRDGGRNPASGGSLQASPFTSYCDTPREVRLPKDDKGLATVFLLPRETRLIDPSSPSLRASDPVLSPSSSRSYQ